MHGLGGNRGDMLTLAQTMGMSASGYAVLAYDARGHGGSGGLIGIDGPKEIADVRAVFGWLRNRPDVADNRIGGWGVSYGGGAAWNSLVAGVPWAALAISISWTDLRQALVPQGLAKSGVMGGFLGSLDPKRVDPEVVRAPRRRVRRATSRRLRPFAAARSSLPRLKGVKTPVFLMQGRRDFAFGLDQARNADRALAGPKRLWIGIHGHAPSSGFAGRHAGDARRGRAVVRPLPARRHDGAARAARGGLARELARAADAASPALPKVDRPTLDARSCGSAARRRSRQSGRVRSRSPRLAARDRGLRLADRRGDGQRHRRLVAARRRAQRADARRQGDRRRGRRRPDPRRARARTGSRSRDQATFLPKGSRLTLTLGSSSLAQNPANLLYLDLPFPPAPGSRVTGRHGDAARCSRRRSPMRRALLAAVAVLAAATAATAATTADPGVTADDDRDRRHRAALRRGGRVRHRRAGREGVLRLRQREGRRQRAEDRVPLLRRRLQPGADRAADAQARRAGPRLRDLQRGRHGEQPRHPRLPERAEGAAALRRRRLGGARRRPARYPWTMGFLQSYRGEGAVLRARPRQAPRRRRESRVLLENTELGKDMTRGLSRAIAGKGPKVVASEAYEFTASDVVAQVAKLKASGADTLMLFATPKFMIQAVVAAHKLGWKPQLYIASVSIEPTIMAIARANAPELTKGARSIAFLKNPNDPVWAKDPALALYRSIMKRYAPGGEADGRLQLVRHDRRLDDGRHAAARGEEPHPREPAAGGAQPRHDAPTRSCCPGIRLRTSASGLLPARHGLPVPLRQPPVGRAARAVPRPG